MDLLPITLPTLLTQDYPGQFHVYLVDDRSSDGTSYVCELFADSEALQGFVSIRAPFTNKRDAIYRHDCLISIALLAPRSQL